MFLEPGLLLYCNLYIYICTKCPLSPAVKKDLLLTQRGPGARQWRRQVEYEQTPTAALKPLISGDQPSSSSQVMLFQERPWTQIQYTSVHDLIFRSGHNLTFVRVNNKRLDSSIHNSYLGQEQESNCIPDAGLILQ